MTCFPSAIPVQKGNPFPVRGKFLKPLPSLKPLYNHPWRLSFLGQSPSSTQGPGLLPTLSFLPASLPIVHPDRTELTVPPAQHISSCPHLCTCCSFCLDSPSPHRASPTGPSCLSVDIASGRNSCWSLLGLVSSLRLSFILHHIPYHAKLKAPVYLFVCLSLKCKFLESGIHRLFNDRSQQCLAQCLEAGKCSINTVMMGV